MRVQQVLMPDGAESWTVLDGAGEVVTPVEAYLAHLGALDRSPTTVRTYATSLTLRRLCRRARTGALRRLRG